MHRPLIRASLPRIEGAAAADARRFPIHHPPAGRRPAQSLPCPRQRGGGGGGGQQFQGNRSDGNGNSRGGPRAAAAAAASRHGWRRPPSQGRHGRAASSAATVPAAEALEVDRRLTSYRLTMADLAGKHGLIVGVANKRSISWAIAQAAAAAGARLALTYPSERLEENVRELAATLDNPLVLPCDVAERRADRRARRDARSRVRRPRFPGARRRVRAGRRARRIRSSQTSREGFRIALDVSAYSLIGADARRGAADGEARRRQHPDAHVHRQRSRLHELQRDGRGEGRARVVGALSGARSRAAEHPRQRDLGRRRSRRWPRPASPGFSTSCRSIARRAPLRRGVETAEVADAALFLLSPAARGVTGEVLMVDSGFHAMGSVKQSRRSSVLPFLDS